MDRFLGIMGSAVYLPKSCVSSVQLDKQHGLPEGTAESRSGVASRYYAGDERQSQMARKAIDDALLSANLTLTDIDCLIAASGTMEQAIPCNAAKILAEYGTDLPLAAFDINMTCLSALMALDLAASLIAAKQYKTILIVSSEVASVGLDWQDVSTSALFGDGAAALVVGGEQPQPSKILASHFRTYPDGVELCEIRGGGSLYHPSKVVGDYRDYGMFRMHGKALYRQTAGVIDKFLSDLFAQADTSLEEMDWIVPHQASGEGLKRLFKRLGIHSDKVINLLASRGNQIAVSIPSALHELLTSYPVKAGDKVLLIGTSAGLSMGAMVITL